MAVFDANHSKQSSFYFQINKKDLQKTTIGKREFDNMFPQIYA